MDDGSNVVTLRPAQSKPRGSNRPGNKKGRKAGSPAGPISGAKEITAAQKTARAIELRLRGYTLQRIADEVGFADPSGAHAAIMRGLAAELPEAQRDQLRRLEIAKVNAIEAAAWVTATEGNVVLDADGEPIILHDADGNEVALRHAPSDKAQQTVLKCVAMRARLQGLEAPQQLQLSTREGEAVQIEVAHIFAPDRMAALDAVRGALVADSLRRAGDVIDVIPTHAD